MRRLPASILFGRISIHFEKENRLIRAGGRKALPRTFRSRYTEYQSLGNGLLFVPIAVIIVRTVFWRWDEGRRAECS